MGLVPFYPGPRQRKNERVPLDTRVLGMNPGTPLKETIGDGIYWGHSIPHSLLRTSKFWLTKQIFPSHSVKLEMGIEMLSDRHPTWTLTLPPYNTPISGWMTLDSGTPYRHVWPNMVTVPGQGQTHPKVIHVQSTPQLQKP